MLLGSNPVLILEFLDFSRLCHHLLSMKDGGSAVCILLIKCSLIGLLTFGSSVNAMMKWHEKPHGTELVGDNLQMHLELPQKCAQECSSDSIMKLGVCNDCLGSVILKNGVPAIDSPPTSCKLVRIFEPAPVFLDLNLPPPK